MLILYFGLIAFSTLIALSNWRAGVGLWFLFAVIQDPIRKVTEGTPVYLTVSFLPIYIATFIGLCGRTAAIQAFRRNYPQLEAPVVLFVVCLLMSFAQALTYGIQFLPAALVGLFSYAGGLPAVMIGYHFIRRHARELDPLLLLYTGLTCLMLIGVPLEQAGVKFSEPWLGTIAMKAEWRRWYSSTEWVVMLSGFYRSPEIMGWHAMSMILLCLHMMIRRPSLSWICIPATIWGTYGVLLSGRRKMYLMIFVFVATFLFTSGNWRRSQLLTYLLIVCIIAVPVLSLVVNDGYLKTAESGLAVAGKKATEKGIEGILWLVHVVGWFGYGVGTKTQGAQHFKSTIETPLVEGGMEKVLVELGVVGFVAAILVALTLARLGFLNLSRARRRGIDMASPAAFLSIIAANLASMVVAFQFFGDPFVITYLGFVLGLLYSTNRFGSTRHENTPRERVGRGLGSYPAVARSKLPTAF